VEQPVTVRKINSATQRDSLVQSTSSLKVAGPVTGGSFAELCGAGIVGCGFVPVEFLSDEEASAYGVYRGAPSQSDLEKLFSWTTRTGS
jgi:hypothetical protein